MAVGQLKSLLGYLHRTAELHEAAGLTDGELLERFLAQRDEAAFELLVRRHGSMVLGVCRRVLPNAHDAEDAFQATFLVLVRRASVVPRHMVGGWLHEVACRTAWAARRLLVRRRAIGQQVSKLPHPTVPPDEPREDLRLVLDQELSQLPDKYRLPLILCDLEGRARRDVARQLRLPDGTLSNRLTAARQRLARQLARRGLTLSSGAVAPLLVPEALAHLPEALVSSVVTTVQGTAAAPALVSLLPIASLTRGGSSMCLSRLKVAFALVLMTSALAGGFGVLRSPGSASVRALASEPLPAEKAPAKKPSGNAPDKKALAASQAALREALKEFAAAEDEPRGMRHRLLGDMAVLQARLGDLAAARKLFKQTGDLIADFEGGGRSGEWRLLATAQAKVNEVDDALATVRRIPAGDQYRDISFQEAATALAKNRREKDALRVGDLIENEKTRAWVRPMLLEQLALAHARAGEVPQALRLLDRIEKPADKVSVLAGVVYMNLSFTDTPHEPGIALLQFEAGKKDEARKSLQRAAKLAATITEKPPRNRALAAVACAQVRMGDLAGARKTAAGISDKPAKPMAVAALARTIALAAIARAQGKAGQAKEARAEADRLPDSSMRAYVLLHLGAGQATAGDQKGARESFRRARDLLDKMPEDEASSHAHNLVSAQGEAGDYEGAKATAAAFLREDSLGVVNIAFSRSKAGDYAGALEMANELKDSQWWKGNLLREIARLQTLRGGEKAARVWIGRLESPLDRANALLGVAEALAKVKR
jgi:RNA polymerase sigma factor (sigma-70 family)